MGLAQKLFDLIYRVEHLDVVRATVKEVGGEFFPDIEILHAKDPSKVRMNRILTEINDVAIPQLEDSKKWFAK